MRRLVLALALCALVACGGAPAVSAPVPELSATTTQLPTVTVTTTATATPTTTTTPGPPTLTPTPGPQVVALARSREIALHTGPGSRYPVLHILVVSQFTVLAVRNERGTDWYHVQGNGVHGWAMLVGLDPAQVARLPIDTSEIAPLPSTPTPRPTATDEPTPYIGVRVGAICRDGTRSNATGRGACSHHGGVAQWIYR